MKTFIFSYLVSVIPLTYFVYPSLQISPLDAVSRIFFYYGFPLAMVLSMVLVIIGHLAGLNKDSDAAYAGIHRAADNPASSSKLKAS